ncbi:FAD-dependent oxidoreductase [Nocardioides solisilvae]|uniref:FAD-dependent oxidoreductase n=1 Tax=Nocardioides solisilvae TaxID=1542435 RepID=UPI000D749322|nr:FAD-dependent oxidoreductase [Nocardioides solisilvae]
MERDDVEVVVVGAGPTGLMLAWELARAGVRTLLLERRQQPSQVARAGGLAGQVLQLLHHRGVLEAFRAESPVPEPPPHFPFGGIHLDFTPLPASPMRALVLPQDRIEALLAERAEAAGAELRRGHEVVGLRQDERTVTLEVDAGGTAYDVSAAFVVGCDGGRSRVRELAGIAFAGDTLPEVERLASTTLPDGVTVRDDGGVEVDGVVLPFGYTATEHGVFACHATGGTGVTGGTLGVYTAEVEPASDEGGAYDDASPMTVGELAASVRRVLGVDLPLGEPLRMTRFGYSARQAETYRAGRVLLAGDAAHLFPAGGVAVNAGMLDAANLAWKLAATLRGWGPEWLLDTYTEERRTAAERTLLHTRAQVALRRAHGPGGDALRALVAELATDEQPLLRLGALMAGTDVGAPSADRPLAGGFVTDALLGVEHEDDRTRGLLAVAPGTTGAVLLLLADRPGLAEVTGPWAGRVRVARLTVEGPPVDALLLRPDGVVATAVPHGEPDETAVPALLEALSAWCGDPARSA